MVLNRVFVYGTLMTGRENFPLVAPYVKKVTPAKSKGILYHLPYGYPAMVDGEGTVVGEVLELEKFSEVIARMDELEDSQPGGTHNLYHRIVGQVTLDTGETVSAYLYLWVDIGGLEELGKKIPHGDWRKFTARE